MDRDADELLQLPFSAEQILTLHSRRINNLQDIVDLSPTALQSMLTAILNDDRRGNGRGGGGGGGSGARIDSNKQSIVQNNSRTSSSSEISRQVNALPFFQVRLMHKLDGGGSVVAKDDSLWLPIPQLLSGDVNQGEATTSHVGRMMLKKGDLCEIEISIQRATIAAGGGSINNKLDKVFAPRYHKPKKASWWLVLIDSTSDELLALKRMNSIGAETTTSLSFNAPSTSTLGEQHQVTMFLVCDCMFGLDMIFHFPIVLA